MATDIWYRILGPIAVDSEQGSIRVPAPKRAAVLAALLLHANRVVTDDRIMMLVWGQDPPPTAKSVLRVHVSELRSMLGQSTIERTGNGYLIKVPAGRLDLQVFLDNAAAAQRELRDGRAEAAAARLRSALRLWSGPALDGGTAALIDHERHSLEESRLIALEDLFEAELVAGNHTKILGELTRLTAEHPFRERLAAQLMLTLYRCGRRPEALRVYTDTRGRLVDELGIEPSQKLRDTQMMILNDVDRADPYEHATPATDQAAEAGGPRIPDQAGRSADNDRKNACAHHINVDCLFDLVESIDRKIDELQAKINPDSAALVVKLDSILRRLEDQ